MRHVREILQLSLGACLSTRVVGGRVGVGPTTVRDTLRRFGESGLTWPLPPEMTDTELEARLYGLAGVKAGRRKRAEPNWSEVARELKRKHVTLQVLVRPVPPLGRPPGAGHAPEPRRRRTAVRRLGEAHNAAFAFFGGVPQLLVPDNAREAVIKACHFEPMVNRSYTDLARHYGTAVVPARPRRPRDKAKVEACVGIVERWVLGRLRNRVFYSLADLNAAIGECLTELNERRVLRQFGVTRRQLFTEVDAPNLKPRPAERWTHAECKRCRVGLDYHVAVDRHHYSVPHRFARREVEVRSTVRTVEVYCAVGHKACRDNRSVLYTRLPRLIDDLALAKGDGRIAACMKALARVDLLILDDWGLEPLDGHARHHLLEILEDRYGRRATMVTSQLPVARWFDLIGDPTSADAILDRLVHNAHRVELTGESRRRQQHTAVA